MSNVNGYLLPDTLYSQCWRVCVRCGRPHIGGSRATVGAGGVITLHGGSLTDQKKFNKIDLSTTPRQGRTDPVAASCC